VIRPRSPVIPGFQQLENCWCSKANLVLDNSLRTVHNNPYVFLCFRARLLLFLAPSCKLGTPIGRVLLFVRLRAPRMPPNDDQRALALSVLPHPRFCSSADQCRRHVRAHRSKACQPKCDSLVKCPDVRRPTASISGFLVALPVEIAAVYFFFVWLDEVYVGL